MTGMIGFMVIIVGAISFASIYGASGLFGFVLMTMIIALLLRARKLRRI